MNPDMKALYQEMILDHYKKPRNYGALEGATHQAKGHNPLCGDRITVFLKIAPDGKIEDIRFEGAGCAISTASASMMAELLTGKTLGEADALFSHFHELLTQDVSEDFAERLGKLRIFGGVREFPMRVKCATLAWHTMNAAKSQNATVVTTE